MPGVIFKQWFHNYAVEQRGYLAVGGVISRIYSPYEPPTIATRWKGVG